MSLAGRPPTIHECLIQMEKRAERASDEKLIETFVDEASLLSSVRTRDHQIIFGRRGTGKTHILKYLSERTKRDKIFSVYIDLRSLGSNGSIYNDRKLSHAQRATPLLIDVLQAIHESLLDFAVGDARGDLSQIGPKLDALAGAISTVEVVGTYEQTDKASGTLSASTESTLSLGGSAAGITGSLAEKNSRNSSVTSEISTKEFGVRQFYIKFGSV